VVYGFTRRDQNVNEDVAFEAKAVKKMIERADGLRHTKPEYYLKRASRTTSWNQLPVTLRAGCWSTTA
jgi:hypothetical protein